jgi:hypothetical protein
VTVKNLTSSPLMLNLATSGSAFFAIRGSTTVALAANDSTKVLVTFIPTLSGNDTGKLTVTSGTDTSSINLIGHAVASAIFRVTPASDSLVFNAHAGAVDTTSIQIQNLTSSPIAVSLGVSGSSLFTLSGLPLITVGANGTSTVKLLYSPLLSGNSTGTLTVSSGTQKDTITLLGHSVLPASNQISVANEVDFSTTVGQTQCLPISITNNTSGAVTISNARVMADSSEFQVSGGGSLQIGSLMNGSLTVCYTPTAASGGDHGTLIFNYSGVTDSSVHGTETVQLDGSAEGHVNAGDSLFFSVTRQLEFNNVLVGQTSCQAVRIVNPTLQAVTIDSATVSGANAADYTVTGGSMLNIMSKSSDFIDVCFSPTAAGVNANGTLNLYYTIPGTSLTGVIPVNLIANAIDTLNNNGELSNCIQVRHAQGVLGPIVFGGSTTNALYLTNRTNSSVTISGATLSGGNASAFLISAGQFPMTLQAGQQSNLMVTFNPTTTIGSPSYNSTITLNATGSGLTCGPITIHVEGVAVGGPNMHDTANIDLGGSQNGRVIPILGRGKNLCTIDTLYFTNTTNHAITVNNLFFLSNPNLTLLDSTMTFPMTVAAGSTLSLHVQFCPNGVADSLFSDPLIVATDQSITPQTYSIQAIVLPAAGVDNDIQTASVDFSIHPNPSSGPMTISVNNSMMAKIEIFDVLGNRLASFDASNTLTWNGRDMTGMQLPSGTYIVRVSGNDDQGKPFRASKEIVIQR